MTTANAKPIITPMPSATPDAVAAAEAAGPGSPEADAVKAAQDAAAAESTEGKPAEGDPAKTADPEPTKKEGSDDTILTLDGDPEPVEVNETGYAEFDAVGKLLGQKGVQNANEIMDDFLETGEISLEHKAQMIEALGEGVAEMAFNQMETAASALINEVKAETAKQKDYANTKFGGNDPDLTWQQIMEYVRTPEAGFSKADLAAMNSMLEAGGFQAQLVIDKVHSVYTNDKTVSLPPNSLLEGDAGSTGVNFEPISRIDYSTEMGKVVGKYGEDSPQASALDKRRMLSIQRGY